MALPDTPVLAGMVSTSLFVVSYLPMLVKAYRTRDLSSYSPGNLVMANVGNAVHSVYVFSLPLGPIWYLHSFYVASTALMLWWYWRYAGPSPAAPPAEPAHFLAWDAADERALLEELNLASWVSARPGS